MKKQFDPTKPVQTRDGRPAQILLTGVDSPDGPVVALVTFPAGSKNALHFYADGRYVEGHNGSGDLVNVPTKVRVDIFINVYPFGALGIHGIRASADQWGDGRIACLHLNQEITEGEGL